MFTRGISDISKINRSVSNSSSIFLDINVRDPFVSDSKEFLLEDTKVVVQSIWRLLTTEEGEIPYFRDYGLSLKKYMQYPLSKATADEIYQYVKGKIETYEQRATIINTFLDVDFNNGYVLMRFTIRVNSTGETYTLPTWRVYVGNNA